jgi:hypothetical protein
MPKTTLLRRTRERQSLAAAVPTPPSTLWANIATITSALVAVIAIMAGIYQFRENVALQRDALYLQEKSVQADRNSKAAEFLDKFHGAMSEHSPPADKNQYERYIRVRNNRALIYLNAVHSIAAGDDRWETVLFWELNSLAHWLKRKQAMCLSLTDDFQKFIAKNVADLSKNFCYDISESE